MPFLGRTPTQFVDPEVDINGGAIDGTAIGASSAAAGTFTNLTATGTLTFPDDGISGDDINGGTATLDGLTVDTNTLVVDSTNNRVGIGESNPDNPLHINSGATTVAQRIDTNVSSTEGNVDFLQAYTTNGYASSLNLIREGTTNTGLAFKTTGSGTLTTRMTIDSSGNVGIGADPNALLDVSSVSTSTIRLSNSDTALSQDQITGQIEFYQADATADGTGITGKIGMRSVTQTGGGTYYGNVANMAFYVSGQANGYASDNATLNAMTIQAGSGNVGIGTSSPAGITSGITTLSISDAGAKTTGDKIGALTFITDDASYTNTYSDGVGVELSAVSDSSTGAAYGLSITTGTIGSEGRSERLRINSKGNVGIGAPAPDAKLTIADAATASTDPTDPTHATISLQYTSSKVLNIGDYAATPFASYIQSTNTSGTPFALALNPSGGNVGIGTNSPVYNLQVGTYGTSADSTLALGSTTTGTGTIRFGDGSGGVAANAGQIQYDHSVNAMTFDTDVTERMRIDSSGNLSVGTAGSSGRVTMQGSTNTSAANCVYAQNSAAQVLLQIRNDGLFSTGAAAVSPYNSTTAIAANVVVLSNGQLQRSTSSLRYKENVRDYSSAASVDALRPVLFNSKNPDDDKLYAGLIAEEVHEAGFTEFVEYNDAGEPDAVFYANMVALCIKEIQDLKAEVALLKGGN